MDPPPFKFPASPGAPLFPLSPERVNGQRVPYSGIDKPLPASPSLPDFRGLKDSPHRSDSDAHVQGMVARFNSLDIKDFKEVYRRDEAAYKRSEMAREMAELELKKTKEEKEEVERHASKYREEARRLRKEVEEGRERERKVAKRVDVLMDELHRSKENTGQTQTVYEKEIRRARKEAFKSSSALVKMQEELKATRNSLRVNQANLESERLKLSRREQDAFSAQYQLVAVQEELEKSRLMVKAVEEERNALKTSLKEEEVARIAAEGGIALPTAHSEEEDDEFASPRKSPSKRSKFNSEDKENVVPRRAIEVKTLQEELMLESSLRARAEEQVEFMKMECQFRCCSCRIADLQNTTYIHDNSLASDMERIKASVPGLVYSSTDGGEDGEMDEAGKEMMDSETIASPIESVPATPVDNVITDFEIKDEPNEIPMDFASVPEQKHTEAPSPQTGAGTPESEPDHHLFHSLRHQLSRITEATIESSPVTNTNQLRMPPFSPAPAPKLSFVAQMQEAVDKDEDKENLPETPAGPVRTITHTTTIPLQFSPAPTSNMPLTPSTISHVPRRSNSLRTPSSASFNSSRENLTADLGNIEIDRAAALEAIRQRRGRARSIANAQMTPRKQMLEGVVGGRRDISAPTFKSTRT